MGKLRRSTPVNSDFIRDIFENDVSEKLKVTMRNGSMYVKIHILVLPDSFFRELLVATPECDQIIIPALMTKAWWRYEFEIGTDLLKNCCLYR